MPDQPMPSRKDRTGLSSAKGPTKPDNAAESPDRPRDQLADQSPQLRAPEAPADLRVMAHELRTPIGAIIAFAEMIEREQFGVIGDARYKEYARDIGSSARLALAIVAASLEQNDTTTPDLLSCLRSDIDIAETIESCLRMVEQPATEAGLDIIAHLPPQLPKLRTDTSALKQILLNLLSNAIKFTPSGGSITVAIAEIDGGLRLTIADTGLGMTAFDRNVLSGNTSASETTVLSGGIGFNLVRRLAAALSIRFDITSGRGVGTIAALTFTDDQLKR